LHETEICDTLAPRIERAPTKCTGGLQDSKLGTAHSVVFPSAPLTREQRFRQSILLTLCESLPQSYSLFEETSPTQWQRLQLWLDYHGLALYFFDRLSQLQCNDLLPAFVSDALDRRLRENTLRTRSLTAEAIAIQREFQGAGLRYALLKGLSLWPSSFSRPELRSQFDLDFLVAGRDLSQAREILARRGYRLYAAGGRSWEFKRNERPHFALHDLYRDTNSWRVELHAERESRRCFSLLERLEWRDFSGFVMPTLSPFDLFLGHGLHACKHVCAEFCRAAHLLEFRQHILFHRSDRAFWETLEQLASENPQSALRLGTVTLLIAQVMGDFAPEALTRWTVDPLPASVRLWIQMYGHCAVLGSFPGSKLYLLLQRELEAQGIPAKRPFRQSLIPSSFPPPIIRAHPGDHLSIRLGRYRMQFCLILSRLRFHLVEGVRFACESGRWRRQLSRVAR
jgi:hypothetical protein